MYYVVYPSIGGSPFEFNVPTIPDLVTIKTDAGDGTDETPIEIPRLSPHTVVLVNFTGSIDTEIFLHISDGAEVGDLVEIISLNAPKISVTNSGIVGIASVESKRALLTFRKIMEDSEDTDATWIGSQTVPPSWDHT